MASCLTVSASAGLCLVLLGAEPSAEPEPPRSVTAGPLKFTEFRLLSQYTYSYACAAADLDGDGDLDLTSSDAEPNSNLYLLLNDGKGNFKHSFIQKYAQQEDQPIRLERHAIGDLNRDGRPDVVIVDNLKWDVRWFENPGKEAITRPWKLHRVAAPKEVPGSYDVALADLDADGDLDVAVSSWRFGNRFDWFENLGSPGDGSKWTRHQIEDKIGETRTIAVADFNRDGKPDLLGTGRTGNLVVWYENSASRRRRPGKARHRRQNPLADARPPRRSRRRRRPGRLDDLRHRHAGLAQFAPDRLVRERGQAGLGAEWKKHMIVPKFPSGVEAVAGDLDGDGDLDVAATGWTPRAGWSGLRTRATRRPAGSCTPSRKTGRMRSRSSWPTSNHDGRLDIAACAERGANELRWWRNEGTAKGK